MGRRKKKHKTRSDSLYYQSVVMVTGILNSLTRKTKSPLCSRESCALCWCTYFVSRVFSSWPFCRRMGEIAISQSKHSRQALGSTKGTYLEVDLLVAARLSGLAHSQEESEVAGLSLHCHVLVSKVLQDKLFPRGLLEQLKTSDLQPPGQMERKIIWSTTGRFERTRNASRST